MKVTVDMERCDSNGVCVGLAPEVFDIDDDMILHLRDANPAGRELQARVREAVVLCPAAAISVSEE